MSKYRSDAIDLVVWIIERALKWYNEIGAVDPFDPKPVWRQGETMPVEAVKDVVSDFEPFGIEMKVRFGGLVVAELYEDKLLVRNEAGAVEARVQREESWTRLGLKPLLRSRSELKVNKKDGEKDLVLVSRPGQLRTIKEWMGPTTPERVKLVVQPIIRERVFWGLLWLVLAIIFPSIYGWFICLMTLGIAGAAYFRPRLELFLAEIVLDFSYIVIFVVLSFTFTISWLFIAPIVFFSLFNAYTRFAKYQLWAN